MFGRFQEKGRCFVLGDLAINTERSFAVSQEFAIDRNNVVALRIFAEIVELHYLSALISSGL